jgi:DHA3 family macrolide efflux protein-like MFS transporter
MRSFYLLLVAQAVSLVGTHVTGFSLSIWMYQETGSITLYGAVLLSSIVPGILVAPLGGVLTDRWNRRLTMLLAHAGGGVCALAMAIAYWTDSLTIQLIVPLLMLKSSFETITTLAFSASTAALVPRDRLDRANGLAQLGGGVAQIASPAMAGMLLPLIGVGGIFVIDLGSFVYAVVVLAWLRMPDVKKAAAAWRSPRAFLREASAGLAYLRSQPALVGLAIIVSFVNFGISAVQFLFAPLVLSFASLRALGFASSLAGVGLVTGSVALSIWGGPRRRASGLLWFMAAQGSVLLLAVAKPSLALATIGAFGVFAILPFIAGGAQTLWQRTVPLELQGRAFAFRMMLEQTMLTLASVLAGPLSDWVFEPLMAPGGALAGALGPIIGTGKGRGVAVLIALLGIAIIGASFLARLHRPLVGLDGAAEPVAPEPIAAEPVAPEPIAAEPVAADAIGEP